MSVGAILGGIAVEVAKEAYDWATDKLKAKAKEKLGDVVDKIDPKVFEALITAQFVLLEVATQGIVNEFEAAEARGKAKPLGGGMQMIECCTCATPELVLEGNGTTRCAICNKPDFASLKLEAP